MADNAEAEDQRSWLPIALAGGFVAFSLLVALLVNLKGDDSKGDPGTARTVLDVASLTVAAVQAGDAATYKKLQCTPKEDQLGQYLDEHRTAKYEDVTGVQTGAFRLVISGTQSVELDVAVQQDGDRSCVSAATIAKATQ